MGYPLRLTIAGLLLAAPALAQPSPVDPGRRIYQAACASCHYRGADRAPFGTRGPPADQSPDELLEVILFGVAPDDDEGGMPAFGAALTNADIAALSNWLRQVSKPDLPWPDMPSAVARMRATGHRSD